LADVFDIRITESHLEEFCNSNNLIHFAKYFDLHSLSLENAPTDYAPLPEDIVSMVTSIPAEHEPKDEKVDTYIYAQQMCPLQLCA
jgi:hypothetical protein